MKGRRMALAALAFLFCMTLTARTSAFLGFGDIVFDPSNYAQAVEQVIRLERQYLQLVQSYQMLRSQYNQLLWNARRVPVNMAARYRALVTPWRTSHASNTYGTTAAWVSAINTGQNAADAYARAGERLLEYGRGLANVPADQLGRLKTSYGTVELADGATRGAIETIGRLRAHAAAVQRAIQGLEDDSLSSAPEMNTEVAVLNKINAANVIAIRTAQDANQLLVALAEQEAIRTKRTRDAEARAFNQHIRFMADGQAVMRAQAAGSSAAMRAWRMP
jgi:hypothetical protein